MHLSIYLVLVVYLVPVVPVIGNNKFCYVSIVINFAIRTLMYSLSLIVCKPFTDIIMLIMG